MGYVIKEIGRPLYVDLNNPTKIYDKKEGEKLFSLGKAQKRTGIGIILYTKLDFNEFYKKHCDRIPNDNNPYTILVDENDDKPESETVKKLIFLALREANKEKTIITDIPILEGKQYTTKTFFRGNFQEENLTKNKFRFKNIKDISSMKELSPEFEEVKNIWKSSFTTKFKYLVKYVCLIGHTDVI